MSMLGWRSASASLPCSDFRLVLVCLLVWCCSVPLIAGDDLDPIVDCRLRDYIYRYATTQVIERTTQQQQHTGLVYGHRSIYDALQLGPQCNLSLSSYPTPTPTPAPTPGPSPKPTPAESLVTSLIQPIISRGGRVATLYVKPTHDRMICSLHGPGRSSHDASCDGSRRDRALFICDLSLDITWLKSYASTSLSYNALIIYLLPGTYYLSKPLILTSQDSHLILTALTPGSVMMTTATRVTATWTVHSAQDDIWVTPCPQCALVTSASLARPLPGTSPLAKNVPQFELYVDGQTQTLARWPNTKHRFTIYPDGYAPNPVSWLAADQGSSSYEPTNMIVQTPERTMSSAQGGLSHNFQELIGGSQAGDQFVDGVQRGVPRSHSLGTTGPHGFVYDVSNFSNRTYANGGRGARVHAFHESYWGNWQWEVSNIDFTSHSVSFGWGGNQQNQGHSIGSQYFIENVLEELDQVTEWYYDSSTTLLYYKPNSTHSSPPSLEIYISTSENLITLSGTPHVPISNIHLIGLTFQYTHPTYLASYITPSGGDWAVHPNGAIYMEGCVGCSIEHCLFQNLGSNGVYISGYNRNITVAYNEFVALGESAIVSVGITHGIDGTLGIHPYGNYIHHNLAHELGLYGKQTAFYFQAVTAYTTLQSNVVFNVPRAGICFNDGFGGGHELFNNVLFNTVRETTDHGAFNSWDRDAFVTRFLTGRPSLLPALSYIHHNLIMSNYESVWPLDHDDGSSWYVDTYNVLIYGGYKNLWGHDMVTTNNLYIYPDAITVAKIPNGFRAPACVGSANVTTGDSGFNEIWANNTCVLRSFIASALLSCSPSNPYDPPNPITHDNHFYSPYGTVYTVCGQPYLANGTVNTGAFIPLPIWQTYLQQEVGSTLDFTLTLTPDTIIQQVQHILPLPTH